MGAVDLPPLVWSWRVPRLPIPSLLLYAGKVPETQDLQIRMKRIQRYKTQIGFRRFPFCLQRVGGRLGPSLPGGGGGRREGAVGGDHRGALRGPATEPQGAQYGHRQGGPQGSGCLFAVVHLRPISCCKLWMFAMGRRLRNTGLITPLFVTP